MDVDALRAAGLYDPAGPGAAERLALLEYLDERGATLAEMVEAEKDDLLYALSSFIAAFGPGDRLPISEVAERTGTSVAFVRRLLLAEGIPVDDRTLVPDFVVDDVAAFQWGMSLFGEEATLAFTRVMGASVARIADAAISLFYGEISPTVPDTVTELERARTNEAAGAVFALLPPVMAHLLEQSFRLNSVRAAAARSGALGQIATLGIGFVDLVGSTEWAAPLSLKDHSLALARFESAAWDIAIEHGGRVVKLIGDEAMIVAESAATVCRIALALCASVADDPGLPGARGAVGFGDVTARGGDYVGPLVNLVARSVKAAAGGTVVVSSDVRRQLVENAPVSFTVSSLGTRELRGIDEPTPLYLITDNSRPSPNAVPSPTPFPDGGPTS